jgi:flavin-dependent dehydrogenase
MESAAKHVVVIGGGPAGSVASLCLRKLGHHVVLFERERFPRYRIGESLLPGTMSILKRLGVADLVADAGFPKKRAATFVWGPERTPWTFTFSTPKHTPWVFDHAYQVDRAEFDQMLLNAAGNRGAVVRQEHEVTDVEWDTDRVKVAWRNGGGAGITETDFVVDATGARGIVAQKLGLRRFDGYFRNMAVWSYFNGGKRYQGDLEGNIFSVAFELGWIWIIPLKDDRYSVGVVTDKDNSRRIKDVGLQAYYDECLAMCPTASETLAGATQCDDMHMVRDWAYDAERLATDRVFLCGDAACFIDPLFSQGVHLATYSAMLAAAAIDRLRQRPATSDVYQWYDRSYRKAYDNYHQFLSAFYSYNARVGSKFWRSRKIEGVNRNRLAGRDWYAALVGQDTDGAANGIDDLDSRTQTLADLWEHSSREITDQFDETELSLRRVKWASQLLKSYKSMVRLQWAGDDVRLVRSYKVDPLSFKLADTLYLGDEKDRYMSSYSLTEEHRELFARLETETLGYNDLIKRLKPIKGGQGAPYQIVGRLLEGGFLRGFDRNDQPVRPPAALRFGGVGAEDDIS